MPQFNLALNGYDPDEVNSYIDKLSNEYHQLAKYCMSCESKIQKFEGAAASFQDHLRPGPAVAASGGHGPDTSHGHDSQKTAGKNGKRIWESRTTGFLFYTALIVVVLVLFLSFSEDNGVPRSIFGFSMMTVLTPSMQDVIPKDSLVVTRHVDAAALEIGDDVTFLVNEKTTMTHRIVGIYENYMNTGARGFETQGTMNASPDREIVAAQNLVGKVVFHNLLLGKVMVFMKKYALWICIFTPLFVGLFVALRIVFSGSNSLEDVQSGRALLGEGSIKLKDMEGKSRSKGHKEEAWKPEDTEGKKA